ncbi:HTH domain protein [Nonomuraea coxensis DSM 45129]|uniref:HTH domain protein n=1 Tax=Nonomuraea coxensis DSM 45129 TaxID=1122611 RepID=A0ABX8TST4_9ACTN|nr:WYL domain-containing protein [Nonomuraea coxensis]QYC37842.1 HTH domain protein [Nonomuraea coxensis DSM 45129]
MTPDRFFSLLLALQTRETITTGDLADQVGVSVRTVLRDLRWLQEAGFPILVERGRWGGVTLLPGGALDTSRLTPTERDHLALHGLDDEQRRQLGAAADSRRAHKKVAVRRSAPSLLPLSAVVTTDNRPWFGPDAQGADPSAIIGDVRRGVRLRILYRRSAEAGPTWQVVDPYGLLAKAGRWYLVADRAGVPRLYSLERLVDWRPMRVPRRLRPETTLAGAAAELTARWETTDALQVHAVLQARQLDRARRILGSRLTVHPPEGGDEVAITVTYRELEAVRQLLQFAESITVTDPPEARARIQELARSVLHHYS